MNSWLYVNILLFLYVIVTIGSQYTDTPPHIIFGVSGLFFILFNWTRHAFFSTIRKTTDRKKKIRLATISKRVYPFHRWSGSLALLLIVLHAMFILERYGIIWDSFKMISGMVAIIFLFLMVLTGWLRLYFPSVKKRKAHILFGFLLVFSVIFHTVFF